MDHGPWVMVHGPYSMVQCPEQRKERKAITKKTDRSFPLIDMESGNDFKSINIYKHIYIYIYIYIEPIGEPCSIASLLCFAMPA